MATDTPEEMAANLVSFLDGTMGVYLTNFGWGVAEMDGLPEFYVRNGSGEVFRLFCEAVDPEEFDPFAADE